MLKLSSVGIHGVALGASAALHVALLVTSVGHPGAARAAESRAIEVQIDTSTPIPVVPDPESKDVQRASTPAAQWPTHTHPYPVPPSHDAVPHDPNLVHVFAPSSPSPTAVSAPQAAPVETAGDATPRFTMAIGGGAADAHGLVSSTGAAAHDHDDDDAPLPEQNVSSPARLAQGAAPAYPPDAREDGVEADVPMEIVVSGAGAVESARVVQRAGHGLDEAALAAVRRFRFTPASKDGRPVRVRMRWTMQFRLRQFSAR